MWTKKQRVGLRDSILAFPHLRQRFQACPGEARCNWWRSRCYWLLLPLLVLPLLVLPLLLSGVVATAHVHIHSTPPIDHFSRQNL